MGGPAGMKPLGPRAIREVFDDSARLASADPEGGDELVLREPAQPSRDGGRRKASRERGWMIVAGGETDRGGPPHPAHHPRPPPCGPAGGAARERLRPAPR